MAAADVDTHDVQSLLSSPARDFLIRSNGDQVKINELKGKAVGLYFSASWCGPCRRFSPQLIEVYNELLSKNDFEVVFISCDHDEESFSEYFSKMPWLAIPLSDKETLDSLNKLFDVSGIPHLVILDGSGKVTSDNGVSVVSQYGAEGYPFSKERIKQLEEEEERARKEQTLSTVLVSPSRDFLISNDGNQVPVSQLEGKMVGLFFSSALHGPCVKFSRQLVQVYHKLNESCESFKVVLISLDEDEDAFKESFGAMPWLAVPFKDKSLTKLVSYFELSALPTLVILGQDGKTLHSNAAELVEEHGALAYPFTPEKLAELEELEKAKRESQTLESILVEGERDFVIRKDGTKVPVSELVGKNILLYFSAHWCPPCRAFLPKLMQVYHEIKAKEDAFEVIFISSDRDESSFQDFFSGMPWLALPFGDVRKGSLGSTFKVRGIPTVIAIGPSGKTVSNDCRDLITQHGAKAYPFTDERLKEIVAEIEEMAKRWPETVKHALHEEHELVLSRRATYFCDGCDTPGSGWSFYCEECDFDLHPKCALEEGVTEANGENGHEDASKEDVARDDGSEDASKKGVVCDGDVCYRA